MFKLVVLFSAVALAAAAPSLISPLALSSIHGAPLSIAQQASSVVHPSPGLIAVPALHGAAAIAPLAAVAPAPLALSPHALSPHALSPHALSPHALSPLAPAVVLNAHGVPLDTPDVVAARALHLQAKALAGHGLHSLRRRSLIAPLGHSAILPVPASIISSHAAIAPVVHSAPILHSAPLHHGIHAW